MAAPGRAREELGSTGIGRHIGILDYRLPFPVEVDERPADWWLFLIPDGCDWDALDGELVHVIFGVTGAEPNQPGTHLRQLELLTRVLQRLEGPGWRALSQLNPFDAARGFNALFEQVTEDQSRNRPVT